MNPLVCIALLALPALPSHAGACRVLVDGAGCRTRQLAIERTFEKLPEVTDVTILPRSESPRDNQRIFLIRAEGRTPDRERLIKALGRRAKFYQVVSVTPASADEP